MSSFSPLSHLFTFSLSFLSIFSGSFSSSYYGDSRPYRSWRTLTEVREVVQPASVGAKTGPQTYTHNHPDLQQPYCWLCTCQWKIPLPLHAPQFKTKKSLQTMSLPEKVPFRVTMGSHYASLDGHQEDPLSEKETPGILRAIRLGCKRLSWSSLLRCPRQP